MKISNNHQSHFISLVLDRPLQGITLTRSPSLPPPGLQFRHIHTYYVLALAIWAHYAATSAFITNSLRRWCYCKPTAHCNKSQA